MSSKFPEGTTTMDRIIVFEFPPDSLHTFTPPPPYGPRKDRGAQLPGPRELRRRAVA